MDNNSKRTWRGLWARLKAAIRKQGIWDTFKTALRRGGVWTVLILAISAGAFLCFELIFWRKRRRNATSAANTLASSLASEDNVAEVDSTPDPPTDIVTTLQAQVYRQVHTIEELQKELSAGQMRICDLLEQIQDNASEKQAAIEETQKLATELDKAKQREKRAVQKANNIRGIGLEAARKNDVRQVQLIHLFKWLVEDERVYRLPSEVADTFKEEIDLARGNSRM